MRRHSEARSIRPTVVNVVKPLEERHAVNKVEARTSEGANVVDDEIDGVRLSTDRSVELSRFRSAQ